MSSYLHITGCNNNDKYDDFYSSSNVGTLNKFQCLLHKNEFVLLVLRNWHLMYMKL